VPPYKLHYKKERKINATNYWQNLVIWFDAIPEL
jgi:hypothetical protein